MPQQSSFKKSKKSASHQLANSLKKQKQIAKNRHGKRIETRKGKFQKKSNKLTDNLKASLQITQEVNLKNELEFARRATSSGGTLRLIKAPEGTEKGESTRPKKQKPVVKIGKGGKRM